MPGVPSWEEIVNRVTIASNYLNLQIAEQQWRNAFRYSNQLLDAVRQVASDSGRTWRGGGADGFRLHLDKVTQALRSNVHSHQTIADGLKVAADALRIAVTTIPVPSWLYQDVLARQQTYQQSGALQPVAPNWFWSSLQSMFGTGTSSGAVAQAEAYYRDGERIAQEAYRQLCREYDRALDLIKEGTRVSVPGLDGRTPSRGSTPPVKKAVPGQQPLSPYNQMNPYAALNQPLGAPLADPALAGTGPGPDPALDTALQSATPLRPVDLAGLGSGGGLGAGLGGGGFGSGGLAGKLPPIGPSFDAPVAAMTGPGSKEPATRPGGQPGGATGTGLAAGAMMAPMAGMHGAAGTADTKTSSTWLDEDQDIFAPDKSVPPSVLDA